jgi:hypothetical protein
MLNIIRKGVIFWIVVRIKHIFQDRLFITEGNQKCVGAIPNFIAKAIVMETGNK